MPEILDCGPLSVCSDCIQLIANDEAEPAHREEFAAFQDGFGSESYLVAGDAENDREFANSRCDGCGTELAGKRHEVFALTR